MVELRRSRSIPAMAGLCLAVVGCGGPAASTSQPPLASTATPHAASTAPDSTPTRAPAASAKPVAGEPIRIALSGAAPDAVALDGDTAWVLSGEGGTLMEVDIVAGREVRAIDVGFGATHLALPIPGVAAVGRFDDSGTGSYLVFVDLATGRTTGAATNELGAMAGGETGMVWALEKDGRLVKVDAETRTVIDTAAIEVGQNVHVEVQWGAGSAWVGSDGLPVVRIADDDLADRETIQVPTGIPFLFEHGLMWGAGPTELWAIDPATNGISKHVPLENLIEILALDIDGDDAWIAARRPGHVGTLLRLDLASGAVVDEFPVSLPSAVRIGPERVWVASYLTNELLGFAR
jgi:hypothetical protein